MKIYTITHVEVFDFEESIETKAYTDRLLAEAMFAAMKSKARENDENDGWHIESDDDNYYESYTDGSYAENHCVIKLEEHEI